MNDSADTDRSPEFSLLVDNEAWQRVSSFAQCAPSDAVFVLDRESGHIIFGDGMNGRRPPVGARVEASYCFGAGEDGNAGPTHAVSVEWQIAAEPPGVLTTAVFETRANGALFHTVSSAKKPAPFRIADMLCGQLDRTRGITFADLVLAVLPWPFHKDLPILQSSGPCAVRKMDLFRLYRLGRLCRALRHVCTAE